MNWWRWWRPPASLCCSGLCAAFAEQCHAVVCAGAAQGSAGADGAGRGGTAMAFWLEVSVPQ